MGFDAAANSVNGGMPSEHRGIRPTDHVRKARLVVKRRLPSKGFRDGQSAGELFAPAGVRKTAIERGVAAHAEYEKVEWIEAAAAKTDFEKALVKPKDFVALWRERPFEVLADGVWSSGRFDRVVFAGGKAVIYDFKTNARGPKEDEAAFARRMAETYAGQMRSYRKALMALTGLAAADISTVLLLSATGAAVPVV